MDIIQEQPAIDILPTAQGGTTTSLTPPADEDQSLASHIEDFHAPEVKVDEPPKGEQPKVRHRAAKDRARPEDVPRIQALSAEVKEWKAKYEQAIAKGQTPAAATQTATQQTEAPKPASAATPDKPTWKAFEEQIGGKYETWGEAQDAYVDARDEWKELAAVAKTQQAQQEQSAKAFEQEVVGKATRYSEQLDGYVKAHPERQTAFQNIPNANPIMLETIWGMDNSPDVVYNIRNTPGLFEEMLLLTEGKPLNQQTVASATTWLHARLQAGSTGAAVGVTYSPKAPRPPTPVRTMPLPPPSAPPGESASLLEHNSFYKTAR